MVEYVKIRGKKYPIKFGYLVLKKIKERTGMEDLKAAMKKHRQDLELVETMLWAALKQGAWEEDTELDLKENEMEMALGSGTCFKDFMAAIMSAKFHPIGDLEEDVEKKLETAASELDKALEEDQETRKRTKA